MRGLALGLIALASPAAACEARLAMVCALTPCAVGDPYCAQEHVKSLRLTYANATCAQEDGAAVVSEGACPDDPAAGASKREMLCPDLAAPVRAAVSGRAEDYPNRCAMAADGAVLMRMLGERVR